VPTRDQFRPPQIQLSPPGLLSLLGLKNGGSSPEYLSNVVAPGFEVSDWYLRASQEVLPAAAQVIPNGPNQGFAVTIQTVPANQWWHVRHYTGSILTGAADTVDTACLAFAFATQSFTVSDPFANVPAASTRFQHEYAPFWVPPGATIGLQVGTAVVAAALTFFTGRLVITRVSV
jgi:hypothetical protein